MRFLQQALLSALTFALTTAGQNASYVGYAFAYFAGDTIQGENIYFAASNGNNALSWKQLNGGQPVLKSTNGTKGVRDPFLIRSHDGGTFYLLATDLSIGSGTSWTDAVRTGSRHIEIWESTDLTTWSAQRHVLVSPPTAGNTWAPKAYYDDAISKYVVYWASTLYAENDSTHTKASYQRVLYATTSDFISFSTASVWQDTGINRIDSTVLEVNGTYYRFTKDDGDRGTGCKDIIEESSSSLLVSVNQWAVVDTCVGLGAGINSVEGPAIFKSNPGDVNGQKFYLFVDNYNGKGYIPLETADIAHPKWAISKSYSLPKDPRHGSVIGITAAEVKSFTGATGVTKKELKRAQGHSPVLPGLYADPNIIAFNNTYYIYPTTDGIANWGADVFYVWKSTNLTNWTRSQQPILTLNGASGNVPWATGYAWAPTIITRAGKYYIYFSGQNPTYNRKTIGVAVASSPEGPFTAQPKAMILNNEAVKTSQAIDPAAFLDPQTNKYYLFWGSGSPIFAQMNDDMVSINQNTIKAVTGLTNFREGGYVNYRKGLYHYTYSVDDTRSEDYRVGYATAPNVTGPWTYRGIILQKDVSQGILGTGGSTILQVPGTDDWYICYHRFAIPNGNGTRRETTIDKITFNSGGIIQAVIPTLTSVPAETIP